MGIAVASLRIWPSMRLANALLNSMGVTFAELALRCHFCLFGVKSGPEHMRGKTNGMILEKYLDSNRRIILNRVLKRKSSHDGVTIIATSYVPEAFKMSTSVFIKMDRGRITQVRSVSHKSK